MTYKQLVLTTAQLAAESHWYSPDFRQCLLELCGRLKGDEFIDIAQELKRAGLIDQLKIAILEEAKRGSQSQAIRNS